MKNKYKIHQSFVKWLIAIVAFAIIFWLCYSNRSDSPKLVFQACMWIAVIGVGLGLVVSLGICIWLLFAKSVLVFDFDKNMITVKNPVLFSKRTTDVRFDEISKISVSRESIYRMINIDVKEPHEKTGMTINDGMTVSANLYFPTSKSIKDLDDAIKRLNSELDIR
ncbi:hypothetical protein [Ligilactobacillus aviarius]|uniref:hypothetical protein n=1 Tax=Ligilactobacillus aviarius TaxID=1606 RepID=UPI00388F96DB